MTLIKQSSFIRNPHFWYIVSLLVIANIYIYLIEPNVLEAVPALKTWHAVFITLRNFLLLFIVAFGTWGFGFKRGLAVYWVIILSTLPHVLAETVLGEFRPEALAEYVVFFPAGILTAWLVDARKQAEGKLKYSRGFFKEVFDSTNDAISIINVSDFTIAGANRAFLEQHGMKEDEVVGKTCYQVTHHRANPCMPPGDVCPLVNTVTSGKYSVAEHLHHTKGNSQTCVEIGTSPIKDAGGKIFQVVHVARDLTAAKQAKDALEEVNQDLKVAQRLTMIGNWKWVIATNNVTWSEELYRINGFDPNLPAPIFADMGRFYTPASWELLNALVTKALNTGESYECELEQIRNDGAVIKTLTRGEADFDAGGKIISLHGTVQDITRQKESEEALHRSYAILNSIVEGTSDAVFVKDLNGRYLMCNKIVAGITGKRIEDIIGCDDTTLFPLHEAKAVMDRDRAVTESGGTSTYEEPVTLADGITHHFLATKGPIFDETGKVVGMFGISRDITERKKEEDTRKWQSELLDTQPDAALLLDIEGKIVYANKSAGVLYGFNKNEMVGMSVTDLVVSESAKKFSSRRDILLKDGHLTFEVNRLKADGSPVFLEIHSALINIGGNKMIVSITRDITERQQLQEQLMSQDRLASIGQLVAGVAHELGNPLQTVILYSELLLERKLPSDVIDDLKTISGEAKRTAYIVENLLSFARKQPKAKIPVDINETVQTVMELRNHEQKVNNILVNLKLAPGLPQVMGNASQLQQVFLNLVINAEQSMLEAHKRGTLTVITERAKKAVRILFVDDGAGISPVDMQKLFTPFFTTKEIGKGTGLGLSVCHGIITEHGGKISAKSEPGKGATFVVELPFSPAPDIPETATVS